MVQREQNAPALGVAHDALHGSHGSGITGAPATDTSAECILHLALALEHLDKARALAHRVPSAAAQQNVRNAHFFVERALVVFDRNGSIRRALDLRACQPEQTMFHGKVCR
jgi:hypothetical protein